MDLARDVDYIPPGSAEPLEPPMTVRSATRRHHQRYSIGRVEADYVEFEFPHVNGRPYRLPLVNISMAGISFALSDHDELALLDPGTMISPAVVRLDACEIRGDMVLMHLTPDAHSHGLCGALFYPASDTDLIKLRSVIAGMGAALGSD